MTHETRERCPRCGMASFKTWHEAHQNAIGYMFTRKKARGFRPYFSRPCQTYHVGRATDHERRRNTERRDTRKAHA
jgi:hypothetical protein